MQIIHHYTKQEVSIADAIEASVDGYSDDQITNVGQRCDYLAKVVGLLVETAYKKGDITDQDIKNMLSYKFDVT